MDNILHAFVGLIGSGCLVFFGAFLHQSFLKRSLKRYGNVILDGVILEEKP